MVLEEPTDMEDTTIPLLMAIPPATLVRGLLMPSPRLRLMLLSCTPTTMETKESMVNDSMVWVTTMVLNGTMDTDTDHTLMPLPTELPLIPLPTAPLPVPLIPPATLARG